MRLPRALLLHCASSLGVLAVVLYAEAAADRMRWEMGLLLCHRVLLLRVAVFLAEAVIAAVVVYVLLVEVCLL